MGEGRRWFAQNTHKEIEDARLPVPPPSACEEAGGGRVPLSIPWHGGSQRAGGGVGAGGACKDKKAENKKSKPF